MKSFDYNTFYIDNDINNDINNDSQKQCLICLQGPEQSYNNIILDDVILINEMHFLIKECKCKCYSHHKCIEKWIQNNSVCPICIGPISFPKNVIKKEIIQTPINELVQSHEIAILQNTYSYIYVCVRIILFLAGVCIFITLININ